MVLEKIKNFEIFRPKCDAPYPQPRKGRLQMIKAWPLGHAFIIWPERGLAGEFEGRAGEPRSPGPHPIFSTPPRAFSIRVMGLLSAAGP